ncbi:MAG: DUF6883 domain-containing protein [Bacteroidota bacterium]
MTLPRADQAVVELAKLRDYALNPAHPRGKHKARVFAATLGYAASDAETLRRALLNAVTVCEATLGRTDEYGTRYTVDLPLTGPGGDAVVRTGWIIRTGEDFPRLTTLYVL